MNHKDLAPSFYGLLANSYRLHRALLRDINRRLAGLSDTKHSTINHAIDQFIAIHRGPLTIHHSGKILV